MRLSILPLFVFTLSCNLISDRRTIAQPQDIMLRFSLKAKESFVPEEPVTVHFTLKNLSDEDLYVLKWYTPLEGLKGKLFKVTRNGEEIPYEGRMVKRGDPGRDDYVRINKGDSATATVDLSSAYNLKTSNEYRVEFVRKIYDVLLMKDVIHEKVKFPRAQEKHRAVDALGNSLALRIVKK